MSSGFSDIPDDLDIDELLAPKKRDKKQSYNIPGTKRRKTVDTSIRTYTNWFKLPHKLHGECQIPSHDEERSTRKKMVADIDGVDMCRWCFIEGRDLK